MGDMRSLNFGIPKRKKYAIDGDESRYIELDTTDTGIIGRWHEAEAYLTQAAEDIKAIGDDMESGVDNGFSERFAAIDKGVREHINRLFDSDVCTPIVGNGSVIRIVNGSDQPIFMAILDSLIGLYETDIKAEFAKSQKRVAKHTSKYRGDESV